MTREEARAELDACTLRPGDASTEARTFAERDPELAQWLAKRTKFDQEMARVFQPPAASAVGHDRLLAAMQAAAAAQAPTRWLAFPKAAWLAAAAAVALLAAGVLWQARESGPSWQKEALALVAQVDAGQLRVDHLSNDLEALKAKLIEASAPVPQSLPKGVTQMKSLACKVVRVAGRPASIVCFLIAPGKEAHLVVIDSQGLRDVPPQNRPQFSEQDGWHIVSWSDGEQSYLLASHGDAELLRKLFAARPKRRTLTLLAMAPATDYSAHPHETDFPFRDHRPLRLHGAG